MHSFAVLVLQIPIPILNILWVSIDEKHEMLSAIRLRFWATELINRSIFLGSAQEGLAMHDIVSLNQRAIPSV